MCVVTLNKIENKMSSGGAETLMEKEVWVTVTRNEDGGGGSSAHPHTPPAERALKLTLQHLQQSGGGTVNSIFSISATHHSHITIHVNPLPLPSSDYTRAFSSPDSTFPLPCGPFHNTPFKARR